MGDYMVHRVRFFDYKAKAIHSLAYDDPIKKLAVSRSDNTIEIWCMKNEYQESVITPSLDRQVEVVLWCRSQLYSAGLDGFIIMYDLAKLCAKKQTFSVGGAIWCMAKNKTESHIIVGTEDGIVAVYEVNVDGLMYVRSLNKQDSRILSIAWHKDEDRIVTGGIDNIRVYDYNSGQILQRLLLPRSERNKETLVWCLAITSNYTIVSGDSRGKTCVWNAEQGTLLKSFQTHAVDVLCLCMDESEEHIYCSGIDPTIVQLDYVTISAEDNTKTWVKSNVFYNHTHDVRAIICANQQLVSAGVDTKLVFKSLKNDNQTKKKSLLSSTRKYQSLPQKQVIDSYGDYILMQYDKYIELWKLGETNVSPDHLSLNDNGDCLPIVKGPRKYLNIKSKDNEYIHCSAIGYMNNALWLSYSDLNSIHIYKIVIDSSDDNTQTPKIQIEKVKSLPLACIKPAVLMKYINEMNRLCFITNRSTLLCLKLCDNNEFLLECCIECVQDVTLTDNHVYKMCCKGDYVATADTDLNVNIWSLKTQQKVSTLPRYDYLCTCMSFDPKLNNLLVCYSNRKIIEYDYELNEYTLWSRETNNKYPKEWHSTNNKIVNCFYDINNANNIIVHDEQYFIIINKQQQMPDFNEKLFKTPSINQLNNKYALHVSNKYRYIIYANMIKNGQLVIVELTPLTINENLPPSLKQKKFAT